MENTPHELYEQHSQSLTIWWIRLSQEGLNLHWHWLAQLALISHSCATCLKRSLYPACGSTRFISVSETMGAVWALLTCLLTVWFAKGIYISSVGSCDMCHQTFDPLLTPAALSTGSCLPAGGTNEMRDNGLQRSMRGKISVTELFQSYCLTLAKFILYRRSVCQWDLLEEGLCTSPVNGVRVEARGRGG